MGIDEGLNETIFERIARLENELREAKQERGILKPGTRVMIEGRIIRFDDEDSTYEISFSFGDDYTGWIPASHVTEVKCTKN